GFGDGLAVDHRGCSELRMDVRWLIFGVGKSVDGAGGAGVAGFDGQRIGNDESGGNVLDIDFYFAFEAVDAIGTDGEGAADVGGNAGVHAFEHDVEIGFGFANGEAIGEAIAGKSADVADADQVAA